MRIVHALSLLALCAARLPVAPPVPSKASLREALGDKPSSVELPHAAHLLTHLQLAAEGAAHKEHKGMSVLTLVINIVADLSPHGMLPLAYGTLPYPLIQPCHAVPCHA